jgi:hypothetical protein
MNKNLPELLYTLDQCPPEYRKWDSPITAYHITTLDKIDSIRESGLQAKTCYQGYDRRSAVYFFLDRDISPENIPTLLGNVTGYAIVTIEIPASKIKNMAYDGLYNATFPHAYAAAMYYGDIPAAWITNIEEVK